MRIVDNFIFIKFKFIIIDQLLINKFYKRVVINIKLLINIIVVR